MVYDFDAAGAALDAAANAVIGAIVNVEGIPLLEGTLGDMLRELDNSLKATSSSLESAGGYIGELEARLGSVEATSAYGIQQLENLLGITWTFQDTLNAVEFNLKMRQEQIEREWQEMKAREAKWLAEQKAWTEAQLAKERTESQSWVERLFGGVFDTLFGWLEDRTEQVVSLAGRIIERAW